ncbi:hypothetical protein LCGC14_2757350, partial [marine sediment metagenome]
TWIADLKKAREVAAGEWEKHTEDFNLFPTLLDVKAFIEKCISKGSLVAVDIETAGLNSDYSDIVVIGLADSPAHAISVPFLKSGGFPYWTNEDAQEIRVALDRLFRNCPLMIQFAFFDVPFLQKKGFDVSYKQVKYDTLVLHHIINPELPHNLGFIVSIYGKTPYWKDTLKERIGSILEIEDKELRTYNLRDCVVLHQVLPPMLEDLEETNTEDVYYKEAILLLKPIGKMMENGIGLSQYKLKKYKILLEGQLATSNTELRTIGKLPSSFNIRSGDDLRYFLFGFVPSKFRALTQLKEYSEETKTSKRIRKKDTKAYGKLIALREVRDETKPLIELNNSLNGKRTGKGQISVDQEGILSLQIMCQNRLEQISYFKNPKPNHLEEQGKLELLLKWIAHLYDYRRYNKYLTTYTYYQVGKDGR